MSSRTSLLAQSPLFQDVSGHLPHKKRIQLSYERAVAIGRAYQLTAEDILNGTPKFWELQSDPILPMDGAAASLLSLHYNLCAGTFARYATGRPDVAATLQRLLKFQLFGQFCLTELAHGLDARNLETTATLLSDGSIDLHTPFERAAKYVHMPPSSPCGIPTMAVVFARLVVNGEDRGIKPFGVLLHDGYTMSEGITSKLFPPRGGSIPLDHCLTYFNHVRLPATALLASPERDLDDRAAFFDSISRVAVGTMSIAGMAVSAMKMGTYIVGRYSQRRKVTDAFTGAQRPIISFTTQQLPVLSTLAQAIVFESFLKKALVIFNDPDTDYNLRHCVAAIAKATLVKHCHSSLISLGDRCGAQGMFEANQLTVMHADFRGAAIAEGDLLGLAVRFAVELVIERVKLPKSSNPDSLLAKHESSMFQELRSTLASQFKHHRDPEFQAIILPQCQPLIEAIGHRVAYDAAVEDGVDKRILDVFVASIVKEDRAWYCEVGGISRAKQMDLERSALKALLPCLDELLLGLDVESYCSAPIISDEKWKRYVESLPTFTRDGVSQDVHPYHVPKTQVRAML
ncbi:acyl-CoA dehydrogenase NM domain-like protein [Flammula alnicola]|nr:acyl-CoA dehydrogenase NM domain-like protein [Flammula alnicola]